MFAWFVGLSTGRKIVGGLIALALIVALVMVINDIIHSLKQAGRDEVQAQWNAEVATRQQVKAEFQTAIIGALQPQFDSLAVRIGGIDTKAADINVKLPQAIAAEPRYIDKSCDLTGPVLEQVNAARALSGASK